MGSEIPRSEEKRAHILARNRALCTLSNVCFYTATALAVLLLIALVVTVVVFEWRQESGALYFILLASFGGGTVLCALAAFFCTKWIARADANRLDFAERCAGENCFFVGEGTLAEFGEDGLLLRGPEREGKRRTVKIPYAHIRLFSVCTRTAPREKGDWSILIEFPSRYVTKESEQPVLVVQTADKPRLREAISSCKLNVLGEEPSSSEGKKFTLREKYLFPNAKKRKGALISGGLGLAILLAGVGLAFWKGSFGAMAVCVGALLFGRAVWNFIGAKACLALYDEGLYWKDGTDRVFLKWEEIEAVTQEEREGREVLLVDCGYGSYRFPAAGDCYAHVAERVKSAHTGDGIQ